MNYGFMVRLIENEPYCSRCGMKLTGQEKRKLVGSLVKYPIIIISVGLVLWTLAVYLIWGYL
jgi:uncharacterized protein (DUF983 family)